MFVTLSTDFHFGHLRVGHRQRVEHHSARRTARHTVPCKGDAASTSCIVPCRSSFCTACCTAFCTAHRTVQDSEHRIVLIVILHGILHRAREASHRIVLHGILHGIPHRARETLHRRVASYRADRHSARHTAPCKGGAASTSRIAPCRPSFCTAYCTAYCTVQGSRRIVYESHRTSC